MRAYLVGSALVVLLAACSSSGSDDPDADADKNTPLSTTVVCAKDAVGHAAVAIPSGFPSNFPFPPGTILLSADDEGSAGIVMTGVTDIPFPQTLKSMNTMLPAAGFELEDGESEPHDAESEWTSATYRGRWAIRDAAGCDNDTSVQVVGSKK